MEKATTTKMTERMSWPILQGFSTRTEGAASIRDWFISDQSLLASKVLLDSATKSALVSELLPDSTFLRERTANGFAHAANASLSLELLANRTLLVEHRLLVALHLLCC